MASGLQSPSTCRTCSSDPSRARPGVTGGLGLAIVRSIMQLHGGSVRVESDAHGTRFMLVFPLAERSAHKQ